VAAAQALGFPVILKLEQPVLAHKTEWGAVRLNLTDAAQVQRHAAELLELGKSLGKGQTPSVLVEAMSPPGIEMLLSLRRDPQFGYTLNAGIGGVNAEIYGDVATRILPVDEAEIRAMLRSLRGYPLLQGYRGRPPADIEAVVAALSRLAALPQHHPGLSEVEINPFVVYGEGQGGALLDALIYAEPRQ
jgi:acyl-CoA synthetase (NDP forming)